MDREPSFADFPHAPSGDFSHIPITEDIQCYFNCELCAKELPDGTSPGNYAKLNVGLTPTGIQIWCRRHNENVAHIDLQGVSHPMNTCREVSAAFDAYGLPGEDDAPDEQSEKIIDVLNSAEALCDRWGSESPDCIPDKYRQLSDIPEFADLQRSLFVLAEAEFGPPEDYEI